MWDKYHKTGLEIAFELLLGAILFYHIFVTLPKMEKLQSGASTESCAEDSIKDPVYVCSDGSSEFYHLTKDCAALNYYCNSSAEKVSKEVAEKNLQRRPCQYCYRKK